MSPDDPKHDPRADGQPCAGPGNIREGRGFAMNDQDYEEREQEQPYPDACRGCSEALDEMTYCVGICRGINSEADAKEIRAVMVRIEAQVREQVAREIEALGREVEKWVLTPNPRWYRGLWDAARIARGTKP